MTKDKSTPQARKRGLQVVAAMRANDMEAARKLLAAGADPNVHAGGEKMTALMYAVYFGSLKLINVLLRSGADIEAADYEGCTALRQAACKICGLSSGLVKRLLEAGANPNTQDCYGNTPLLGTEAISAKREAGGVVDQLLEAGADPNAQSQDGDTPLTLLQDMGPKAIRALLAKGADPNARCARNGEPPLLRAAGRGSKKIVEILLNADADPNQCASGSSETPVIRAVISGVDAVVKQLLAAGADPNLHTETGKTALMCAAERGQGTTIKLLLDGGAKADLRVGKNNEELECGGTALMYAALCGSTDAVKQLLAAGAAIDLTEQTRGATPLVYAIAYAPAASIAGQPHVTVARMLLDAGANPNVRMRHKVTPLMVAANAGNDALVRLLLERKADPALVNASGETALDLAEDGPSDPVRDVLRPRCAVVLREAMGKGRKPRPASMEAEFEEELLPAPGG